VFSGSSLVGAPTGAPVVCVFDADADDAPFFPLDHLKESLTCSKDLNSISTIFIIKTRILPGCGRERGPRGSTSWWHAATNADFFASSSTIVHVLGMMVVICSEKPPATSTTGARWCRSPKPQPPQNHSLSFRLKIRTSPAATLIKQSAKYKALIRPFSGLHISRLPLKHVVRDV
jgi:hypothetical protein